jgi:cobalt-zinc-cadmium resistance protein CzcA
MRLTAIFALLYCLNAFAQNAPGKIYSLQQCIDISLKNNENLNTAGLNVELQKQNKKNSGEIPKTNVVYTQGQFNSIYRYDENITVSQSMPFPTVFSHRNAQAKTLILSSEHQFEAVKADLIYQVKSSYYSLLYANSINQLLKKEDSIYIDFGKAVEEKFAAGKGTLLEKTSAETEMIELQNRLLESEEDINSYFIQLQTLMNSPGDFDISYINIREKPLVAPIDTSILIEHPALKHLKDKVKAGEQSIALEKSRLLPDLTFSYFNQTIWGPANIYGNDYFLTKKDRLQGVIVGLALPLWFQPLRAKVQSARILTRLAQSDYDYNSTMMQGQYSQAVTLYLKYKKSIAYYEKNALNNSKIIIEKAFESYARDEISYIEYIQIVGHAMSIESHYLEVIHNNNIMAIKIEYLLTK